MASGAYTQTHTHALKVISRNQARAGLWPVCAWFNSIIRLGNFFTLKFDFLSILGTQHSEHTHEILHEILHKTLPITLEENC